MLIEQMHPVDPIVAELLFTTLVTMIWSVIAYVDRGDLEGPS